MSVITWENWQIITIHNEDIYVQHWCEDQSPSTNYCMHWVYELSMTKTELKDLGTSLLFNTWVMIIVIIIIITLIRGLFRKMF